MYDRAIVRKSMAGAIFMCPLTILIHLIFGYFHLFGDSREPIWPDLIETSLLSSLFFYYFLLFLLKRTKKNSLIES